MIPKRRPNALGLIAASLAAALLAACGQPGVQIGGPFHLTDQYGRPQDQSILKGKWSAVFFGYTYCPDVCPTTLQTLAEAQDKLGDKARRFQVVFISVDPGRDTPAQLKTYLSSPAFPRGAIGLTGTDAQVAAVAKAYHAYYQKQGSGPGYEVQHGSAVYLMDPEGRFSGVVAFGLPPAEVARQISDKING
jgi:protein SCO1/2